MAPGDFKEFQNDCCNLVNFCTAPCTPKSNMNWIIEWLFPNKSSVLFFIAENVKKNILWCHFFRWRDFFVLFLFFLIVNRFSFDCWPNKTKQNTEWSHLGLRLAFSLITAYIIKGDDNWSLITFCCSFLHEERWTMALHLHLFHKIEGKISWTWVLLLNSVL